MRNGRSGFILSRSPGFTLPIMLVILAGLSGSALHIDISNRYRLAREREAELIFRGLAYVRAIERFYLAEEDPEQRKLPQDLSDLENDPRTAHRRHIRRLYKDPLTGKPFRVLTAGGQITGVASTSSEPLFQRTGYSERLPFAAGAEHYDELHFEVDLKKLEREAPQK